MSLAAMLWASNLDVPASTKLVAMIMGDHANTKNECWPSKAKLARRCSLSKGTISRALKELQEWGLLDVEAREHENGKPRSNKYTLRLDRVAPPDALDRSTIDPSPGDDEEIEEETTACNGPSDAGAGDRVNHESIPRVSGEPMGRSHGESMDGFTIDPTSRNSNSEPSPFPPKPPASAAKAAEETASASASGNAAGSAGKTTTAALDPNSDEFKRSQFKQLVETWQQHNMVRFAGDETAALKFFRGMPLEERSEAVLKAPNYLKGKKAEYAEWKNSARADRARTPPKTATVKEYLGTRVYKLLGMPKEPPAPPKPVSAAWAAAVRASSRSMFDEDAVFVAHDSDAFAAWIKAERRAGGMTPRGGQHFRKRDPETDAITWTGYGRFFASEWPPREEEFQEAQFEPRIADRAMSGSDAQNEKREGAG
jgi:hypothetical protein